MGMRDNVEWVEDCCTESKVRLGVMHGSSKPLWWICELGASSFSLWQAQVDSTSTVTGMWSGPRNRALQMICWGRPAKRVRMLFEGELRRSVWAYLACSGIHCVTFDHVLMSFVRRSLLSSWSWIVKWPLESTSLVVSVCLDGMIWSGCWVLHHDGWMDAVDHASTCEVNICI